jgi:oxaloacetate decarboxylase alpha subunit
MTDVRLVDVSLRDGNQSLWGMTGVTTRTVERMSPLLDQVGYRAVEAMSSTQIAVAVRYHREDPWARLDAGVRGAPHTTWAFITTGRRFITFYQTPTNLLELAYSLLRRHGVQRMWVVDPMLDMTSAKECARIARRAGFDEIVGGVCYTLSPVHTDEFFANRVAELDECEDIDSIYLKDPAGLLTPERVRSLVPLMQSRLNRLRIDEIHSHCNTGLAPLTLLAAADLGISTLHCALPPLAYGTSHTSGIKLVHNLRARGHRVDVDLEAMEAASACLKREAKLHGLPSGAPAEYDEAYYRHTVPGGVITTTARQLSEMGRPDLLPAVLEESVHVRRDLGWPIVVTPFAQYIVTQAAINVIAGERYKRITNEVVDLLLGEFGPTPGPVNSDLLDRATSSARARYRGTLAEAPSIADLRVRFGTSISDEDLLLRAVMPAEQVDAMAEARSRGRSGSLRELTRLLESTGKPSTVSVSKNGTTLSLKIGNNGDAAE